MSSALVVVGRREKGTPGPLPSLLSLVPSEGLLDTVRFTPFSDPSGKRGQVRKESVLTSRSPGKSIPPTPFDGGNCL